MVFYNGDDTFEESMSTYWTAQEADYPPACIVRPVTTQDLSVAVQSLANISEAIDDKPCYFAVRSGGSGHDHKSNEPDGVNIDLTTWKTIHLPPDHKTAQIRPGYTFAEVYAYLEQYNLTVAGPRYATIGVGGYSLGG